MSNSSLKAHPLRFVHRGNIVTLDDVPPDRTLLQVIREDVGLVGTKEGCNEGDCGACTVVLGRCEQPGRSGRRGQREQVRYTAVNSCIKLAHAIDGMALWTVQDIAPVQTLVQVHNTAHAQNMAQAQGLHPVQQALLDAHASQCGFCTPGFVMSLFALYQTQVCQGGVITRDSAQQALSGNLCRCTGYRPILDAAVAMHRWPAVLLPEADLLHKLKRMAKINRGPEAGFSYITPKTLIGLLTARARHPDAQLVAGCTDVGLWVTKQHRQFRRVLDLTQVQELRRVERYANHIAMGAAVNLADAFDALVQDRPQLRAFADRFAGLPVRNSGTLGGNVANGSPIGDGMPLLIALGASVVLMRMAVPVLGEPHTLPDAATAPNHGAAQAKLMAHREMALEDFYTGYRTNVLAGDEVLAWIKVPLPGALRALVTSPDGGSQLMRVTKISKRLEDDISAVCLAIDLDLDSHGHVVRASIGAGGVAATPMRARATEAELLGKLWSAANVRTAITVLRDEFSPISDLRASSVYRREVLGSALQRLWLESQGLQAVSLEMLKPETLSHAGASA